MAHKKVTKKTPHAKPQYVIPLIVGLTLILGIFIGYKVGNAPQRDQGTRMDMWHEMKDGRYRANWRTSNCQALQINTPQEKQQITSPLTVSVTVNNSQEDCHWNVFEAQAGTIELKNNKGEVITTSTLKTTDEWMTDEPTTYTGTLTFTPDQAKSGLTLVIDEETPSGETGKQVTLPLTY